MQDVVKNRKASVLNITKIKGAKSIEGFFCYQIPEASSMS